MRKSGSLSEPSFVVHAVCAAGFLPKAYQIRRRCAMFDSFFFSYAVDVICGDPTRCHASASSRVGFRICHWLVLCGARSDPALNCGKTAVELSRTSLKSKDFPCRIRAFLWKTMHGAYKCGKYWANIPTCEHRGICHACEGVEESMEHILT
jgi:hypothetical protein